MAGRGLTEPSYLGRAGVRLLIAAPVMALIAAVGYLWFQSRVPEVEVAGGFPRVLGPSTEMRVRWVNPRGARRVTVLVMQGGVQTVAFEKSAPPERLRFSAGGEAPGEELVRISRKEVPRLTAGKATIVVEVQSKDLRGQVGRISKELAVVLEKPVVTADTEPVFFRRGGTGVVTFTAGGGWSEAGVRVGKRRFPSWPLGANAERRICLFTVSPEAGEPDEPLLFARNELDEEATARFRFSMGPAKFRERTLEMNDGFLRKVVEELDAGGSGDLAERFAKINSEMRRANDAALAALAPKSEPKRMWEGTFAMLPRGKAEAMFADHRTYRYGGKTLNREWHLGIDMASVKNAAVPAGNRGRVIFAGRLGIYGNCVVIDHGMGLMTVYGHLSSLGVKAGDGVGRGQEIGKSGMTGLAGGDHLHFGVLAGGVFVDPLEWADAAWMKRALRAVE